MLIRISLCLLYIYACSSGEFKGHQIDKSANQTPTITDPITPTDPKPEPECLKTCGAACQDWGEWSAWSPATDTVCEEKKLTQKQTKTRTCKATCPEVKCLLSEKKDKEVDGTKDCTDPPPPCQTSCEDGCKEWQGWSAWSPAAASMCKGDEFTQTRARTRECFPACDDKAECLCPSVQCDATDEGTQTATGTKEIDCQTACDAYTWGEWLPQAKAKDMCKGHTVPQTRTGTRNCRDACSTCKKEKTESQTLKGIKVTDCQKDCTPWQAVTGVKGKWSRARNTVAQGTNFKQQRTENRTCSAVCPGSNCKITRVVKRDAVGTKQPPPPVVTPPPVVAPPPVVTPPPCNSCSAGCEAWQDWGAWIAALPRCPTAIAFGTKLLAAAEEHRSRTRTCNNNLCADAECFTSNSETRTTPCTCPEGKVLADDGTCVCDPARRLYKVGNACQLCPSDYNFTQVDGSWTCEQTCTCCTDWKQTDVSQQASEVCKDSKFRPEYTYDRTCDDCPAGNTCLTTKKELAALSVQGTKTTKNCDDHCKDWSSEWTWTADKVCPPSTSSFTKSSATFTGTKSRTCTGLCSASDCEVTDNSGRKTEDCDYCQGKGQIKLNQGKPTEMCVCDTDKHYYRTGDTCTLCEPPKKFEGGQCKSPPPPSSASNVSSPDAGSEDEPPPKVKTCAEGCGDWDLTDWGTWKLTTAKCHADTTSFTKPKLAAEQATRTRTRECENLPADLECFTANTETRTTVCEWCQGEGQKLDATGQCVCDADSNYYKDGHYDDRCTSCGDKVVNTAGTACVCAESSCINSKKAWNSDTCSCGECRQEVADACYPGSLDASCVCIPVAEIETETETEIEIETETKISISIYNGRFLSGSEPILHLPSGYESRRSLLNALPSNNHYWKLDKCFDSDNDGEGEIEAYNAAIDAIRGVTTDAQAAIQKLYNCAKDEDKQDFIDALTGETDSSRANSAQIINVEITQ